MKAMIKLIHLLLLVTFIAIIETAREPCSTANLPVVNICADDTKVQDISNSILIKADTRQNCTCELSVTHQDKAIPINILRFDQKTSSSPSAYGCGLILQMSFGTDNIWEAPCIVDNSIISRLIVVNAVMTIRSFAVNGTLQPNEGYCIEIRKELPVEVGNKLILKCGIGSTATSTTTQSTETKTKTKTTKTINLLPTTTTVTTTAVPTTTTTIDTYEYTFGNLTSTDGFVSTKQANQQLTIKGNDDTTGLAAGVSVGGFVIVIIVIVVVCIYRQYHQKPTFKPGPAFDNDYDAYGMRDNVLYVSSQPADTTETQNKADSPNKKRISVDIDGNYSTVDLDEITSVEDSTGDYSSIDLEKLTPSKSNLNGSTIEKPIIAPKPKQKVTIQNDVHSVPDKKRVTHVTAPGENGCEYAVVSKPNKLNFDKSEDQPSKSNLYADVEKKKCMSNGKGTNQKRDSLTAENDGESGQS